MQFNPGRSPSLAGESTESLIKSAEMPSLKLFIGGGPTKGGFRSTLRHYRGKENFTVHARNSAGRRAGKRILNFIRIYRLE